MEHYIAIDNVCAWPNLTPLPNGDIIAMIFNQPTHGGWEGEVECWISQDDGRTWRLHGVPAPHEPGTNRMNVAAGCAHDGSLLVLVSGWNRRNAVGNYSDPTKGELLPTWVCRSDDGGSNWKKIGSIDISTEALSGIIPFGDIVKLPDGALGACLYNVSPSGGHSSYFYSSPDDGRTWMPRKIIRKDANESTPLVMPDGHLLAAVRTLGDQHLEIHVSKDNGDTWKLSSPVTLGRQYPGHLLRLKDGRLLLSYGLRNEGLYGIAARLSLDEGKTWMPPRFLVDFQIATDSGYPSSVEADDGTIITAYYSNKIPTHQRYHMGVIRWCADSNHGRLQG